MDVSNIVLLLIVPLFFAGFQSGFHISCESCERMKNSNLNVIDFISRFTTSSLYTLMATVLPCLAMFECESIEFHVDPKPLIVTPIALGALLVVVFVFFLMAISTLKTQVKNKWAKIIVPIVLLIIAIILTLFIILLRIKK
jgi:cytochrome bd-type quinol oxidase subunit 2